MLALRKSKARTKLPGYKVPKKFQTLDDLDVPKKGLLDPKLRKGRSIKTLARKAKRFRRRM